METKSNNYLEKHLGCLLYENLSSKLTTMRSFGKIDTLL